MQLLESSNASFASEIDSRSSVGTHTPRSTHHTSLGGVDQQRPRRRRQSDLREKDLMHATELRQHQARPGTATTDATACQPITVPPIALHALLHTQQGGRRVGGAPAIVSPPPQQQHGADDNDERRNRGSGKVAPASGAGHSKASAMPSSMKNFDYSPVLNSNNKQRPRAQRSSALQATQQATHASRRVFHDAEDEDLCDGGRGACDGGGRVRRGGPCQHNAVQAWVNAGAQEATPAMHRAAEHVGVDGTDTTTPTRRGRGGAERSTWSRPIKNVARVVALTRSRARQLTAMLTRMLLSVCLWLLPCVVREFLFGGGQPREDRRRHQGRGSTAAVGDCSLELLWGAIRIHRQHEDRCNDHADHNDVVAARGCRSTATDDDVVLLRTDADVTMGDAPTAAETRKSIRRLEVRLGALQSSLEDVVREVKSLDGVVGGLHHLVDQHEAALHELQ